MSLFSVFRKRTHDDNWKRAIGVLPVERALADEHEAMHGESVQGQLDDVTVAFDASQFLDIPAVARRLLDARDAGLVEEDADGVRALRGSAVVRAVDVRAAALHEPPGTVRPAPIRFEVKARTPLDEVGKYVLASAPLQEALREYEMQSGDGRWAEAPRLAQALATRFNELLAANLAGEPLFHPFVKAGAVQALGERSEGTTAPQAAAEFNERASRALLEAVFPGEIAQMRDRRLQVVFAAARDRDTAALCLSGGGIRSSTFALGVMQGLAHHGLLGKFDYLSTVSGGGLSGGWLTGWMRRQGAKAVHEALRAAGGERQQPKLQPEPQPVRGLREFSNWLTPSAGAASVDSWTVIMTVVRNLLLNWLVLLPLLAGIVMLPRVFMALLAADDNPPTGTLPQPVPVDFDWDTYYEPAQVVIVVAVLAGAALLVRASLFIEKVRSGSGSLAAERRAAPTREQFLSSFLAPRVVGSTMLAFALYLALGWDGYWDISSPITRILTQLLVPLVVLLLVLAQRRARRRRWAALKRSLKAIFAAVVAYGLATLLLIALAARLDHSWYVTIGPAVMLMAGTVASQFYTGLVSDQVQDDEREWAARADAWLVVAAIAWTISSALVLLGPSLLSGLWQKLTLLGIGGVSSWVTIALSKSPRPRGEEPSAPDKARGIVLSLAAPAVVACTIIGLAAANNASLSILCAAESVGALKCNPVDTAAIVGTVGISTELSAKVAISQGTQFGDRLDSLPRDVPQNQKQLDALGVRDDSAIAASHEFTLAFLEANTHKIRSIQRDGPAAARDTLEAKRKEEKIWGAALALSKMQSTQVETKEKFKELLKSLNDKLDSTYNSPVDSTSPDTSAARNDRIGAYLRVQQVVRLDTTLATDFARRDSSDAVVKATLDSVSKAFRSVRVPEEKAAWIMVLGTMVFLLVMGWLFSRVVNTNTFSLHAMWRARTVRAFLGTTRVAGDRNPNPFTGFDSDDDIPLRELWPATARGKDEAYVGERSERVPPMHVLNVTLNLAAGGNLAWQQRKAESMTLTPLHGGSAFVGYRRMRPGPRQHGQHGHAAPSYGGPRGLSLGTAMAISGAAASPNDGSGTTALGAFLMTFFNARLGRWLGNPGAPGSALRPKRRRWLMFGKKQAPEPWQRSAPEGRLQPIVSEMLGRTSDRTPYVYLSDGGHFENLALYEMVLRRNRFIVLSDAGADPGYTFEDLGNAVRKIRIDFGVPIDFESGINIRARDGSQAAYWATARIRYSAVDMPPGANADDYDGVLVYLKPVSYLNEDRDVVNYAKQNPSFPQESSADQNYSEAQFESYRALGAWIVDRLVAKPEDGGPPVRVNAHRPGSLLSLWPQLGGQRQSGSVEPR